MSPVPSLPKFAKYFVTVDDLSSLKIWDLDSGQLMAEESQISKGLLSTCAIDPIEGKLVACGGIDGKVHVYHLNLEQKKKMNDKTLKVIVKRHEFSGHQSLVTCCGFLSNNYLISGSDDSDLLLWDFENTGRYLVKYTDHQYEVQCLDVFSRDGNVVASGANDAAVRIWDIRMKQPCIRVFDKNPCGISAVRFMPDNMNTLAIGRDDSSINLIDLRTLGKFGKYKEKSNIDSINGLQFSKSGRILFSCSQSNNRIIAWDTMTEQKAGEFASDIH
mmetsp:Transcript_17497/g.29463  ORF Transcript_17497/g.29463 Transcript_17497/m.29463 type:complete len:274 (+) Transcript_17497:415-1236(+)